MIYKIPANFLGLHKSLRVTICQNEAYASLLWVIPITGYRGDRSSVRMQKWPVTGRPSVSGTVLHRIFLQYTPGGWTRPQTGMSVGVYALLHQDNSCRVGRYWWIPSIQWAVEQKLHQNCAIRQKLHAPSTRPKLRKNCAAHDRNFLGALNSSMCCKLPAPQAAVSVCICSSSSPGLHELYARLQKEMQTGEYRMDYLLISDFHPLSTPSNAIWKLTFSNSPSTPLPCCPASDCQCLWFSIITELAHIINACIIIIIIMCHWRPWNVNFKINSAALTDVD